MLKELLTDEPPLPLSIDASAREVLTEVGNILLNACLGTFGNILEVQVSFSVPHLNLETLRDLLESLLINREGLRYALVVHAGFRLRDAEVTGYLVIVLSVASLDRLIRAVEAWEAPLRPRDDLAASPTLLNAAMLRWLDELSGQGVFITDTELVIRSWNRWLERSTGLPSANVIGRPLLELFPGSGERGLDCALPRRAQRRGERALAPASRIPAAHAAAAQGRRQRACRRARASRR